MSRAQLHPLHFFNYIQYAVVLCAVPVVQDLPREQWFEMVKSRGSAKSRGLARDDRILMLDQSGPETALAKVACQLPP